MLQSMVSMLESSIVEGEESELVVFNSKTLFGVERDQKQKKIVPTDICTNQFFCLEARFYEQLSGRDPTLQFFTHNLFLKIVGKERTSPLDSSDFFAYLWILIIPKKLLFKPESHQFVATLHFFQKI